VEKVMKSTSITLFILGAVAAGCLIFMEQFLYAGGSYLTATLICFLIIGIFNLIFMTEKKTNKKLLLIHLVPLVMFIVMNVDYAIKIEKMGYSSDFYIILYLLPYLIPHILSFCAHFTYIEYITKNQAKDKHIADLEAEIAQLKNS
jgi:peptidoglycan/LPS O-acetylase OafA/YrhL